MTSTTYECATCKQLQEINDEQKQKLTFIEKKLTELVRAYKLVCHERDTLLATTSPALESLTISQQQQERISALEANVAHLSEISGQFESQKLRDKVIIERLQQKCQDLTIEIENKNVALQNVKSDCETNENKKRTRSRATQVEEFTIDTKEEDENMKHLIEHVDQIIQTDFDNEIPTKPSSNRPELAIVIPRQQSGSDEERSPNSLVSPNFNREESPVITRPSNTRGSIYTYTTSVPHQESLPPNPSTPSASSVSLFYVNELARKEIDLAELRLQSRELECALRELQWKYNNEKYRLQSRITELERYQSQCAPQTKSEPNFTYIRNVLLRLLNTKDKQQRQFMINALLAALDAKETKEVKYK